MSTSIANVGSKSKWQAARSAASSLALKARTSLSRLVGRQPLWRNPTYLTLWGGKIVSATGSQMTQVAFPLLVLAITHSAAIAGIAGALRMLPYLLLSLPAGALVDRWDRRRTMLLCDTGRAIALGSIPVALLLGHLTVVQIFIVALVEGSLFVIFDLAELAALPAVVPQDQMAAATAQYLSLTEGVTTLLGPALGGALFAFGRSVPFLIDTVSYLASIFALSRIKLSNGDAASREDAPLTWQSVRDDIFAGVLWLWRQPTLRVLTLFLGINNALFASEALLVIELADHQHATTPEIGTILAIGGAGTIAGALIAERIAARFSFSQLFLPLNWIIVPFWMLYAIVPLPFMLGLVMAAIGVIFSIINVTQFTYRMSLIPERMQGRISSIIRLFVYGGLPVGMALAGILIQQLGPVTTVVILGVCMLLLAALATLMPQLRNATSPAATVEADASAKVAA